MKIGFNNNVPWVVESSLTRGGLKNAVIWLINKLNDCESRPSLKRRGTARKRGGKLILKCTVVQGGVFLMNNEVAYADE